MNSVTVITATFNSEETLSSTFDSIIQLKNRPLQYIVVDGGSGDNTLKIIDQYCELFKENQIDFQWISEPDDGIYDAWNKGLKLANSKWIAFIGADDCYRKGAIQQLLEEADADEYDFVTGKCEFVKNGKVIRRFGEHWNWAVFKREMKILHAGGLHNAVYFERYGDFDANFKIAGDYELLLRAGSALRVQFIDQTIISMGADGVSSSEVLNVLNEARKAKVKNGARRPFLAMWDMMVVYSKIKLKSFAGR